jgi:TrmH family RNA methyltransferase
MKTISSRQNPTVRLFRDLADAPDPAGARLLLDGLHLVRDARAAGLAIEIACVTESRLERDDEEAALAHALDAEGVPVVVATTAVFSAISPVRTPSGIIAIARRIPANADAICAVSSPLVLVAADVQDPGNVGALLRVAEAAGATGALVTGMSANPFSWKAVRGSMGSALRLPAAGGMTIDEALAALRRHQVRTVAAVPRGGVPPDAVNWRGAVAVLVGSEGPGLDEGLIASCDERATIPMAPAVESLNVAVAGAILLYAARRQRES